MVYIADNIGSYKVSKGAFGKARNAEVKVKLDYSLVCDVGSFIELYLAGKRVFDGVVRKKQEYVYGAEIAAVGREDILYRIFDRRIIKPADVGEIDDMDISEVVAFLVKNYTDFNYIYGDTIEETGVRIRKFVLNDYISNVLNTIAKAVGFVWYVEGDVFYFVKPKFTMTNVQLTNKNAYFEKWDIKTDRLVNDLSLIGGSVEYIKSDFFRGDGTTKEFILTYIPSGNVRVFVDGVELSMSEYELDRDVPKIIFKNAPRHYDINGDDITYAYSGWIWRRKITFSIDSDASPSSVTDPVFLLKISDSDFDWQNVKSDYSDVRFVINNNGNVVELPYVYLGRSQEGNIFYRYFVIRYSGTVNAGDSVDVYMLYGNPDSSTPGYDLSDVLIKYDEFNYDGVLSDALWTKKKVVEGYKIRNGSCSDLTFVRNLPDSYIAEAYAVSDVDGYAVIYAKMTQGYGGVDVTVGEYVVESNSIDPNTCWVYWTGEGFPHIVKGDKLSVGVRVSWSSCCSHNGEDSLTLLKGVYYFTGWDVDPSVAISDRQLNSTYNIEVRYTFKAPIYVRISDRSSIDEYGLFSKVIRADWIKDWTMAYTMAVKYLNVYRKPLYESKAVIPLVKYLDYGLKSGDIVYVDDKKQGVSDNLVIYSETFKNGRVEIIVGSVTFDVFEWGANVEERIRQLETVGDENFFTP